MSEERTLRLTDEVIDCIEKLQAAMWDAHYGNGIEVGYAQKRDREARSILAKLRGACDHGFYDRKLCMECLKDRPPGESEGELPTKMSELVSRVQDQMDEPQRCVRTGTDGCPQKQSSPHMPMASVAAHGKCHDCERRRPECAGVRAAYDLALSQAHHFSQSHVAVPLTPYGVFAADLRALVKAAGEAAVKRYERAKWEKGYASLKDIGGGDDV